MFNRENAEMMDSMRKPQTDEVARGPGTGESMAVRDFIQGTSGSSGSLLCYLGQEFQYFERFSYLRLCSSVRCASIYSLTVSMETEPVVATK